MSFLVKFRYPIAIFVLIVSLLPGKFIEKAMLPNNSLTVWFVKNDPLLKNYKSFHHQFGNDEVVTIGIKNSKGIFNKQQLENIRLLTKKLEKIDGVSRVYSITNSKDIFSTEDSIEIKNAIAEVIPSDEKSLNLIKKQTLESPLILNRLIDQKGEMTLVLAQMKVMDDIDSKRDSIIANVKKVTNSVFSKGTAKYAGLGVIYSGLNLITQHDFTLFVGLSYLLMFFIIFYLYRSVILVFYSLTVVIVSTMQCLAIYGYTGHQVNMVTMVLPTLIIILGLADVMHAISDHADALSKGQNSLETVTETLKHVFKPCLFTTLTTSAGFLSLTVSKMAVLKEFGLFAAIGMVLALINTFVFGAFFLPFLKELRAGGQKFVQFSQRILNNLLENLWNEPKKYFIRVFILSLIVLGGIPLIITDTYTLGYLPDDHQVVKDHEFFEKNWGNYAPLELTIRPKEGLSLKSPKVLKAMDGFGKEAIKLKDISQVFSLLDPLKRVSYAMGGSDAQNLLFTNEQAVSQNILLLEMDQDNELFRVTNDDYSLGRISLTGKMQSARDLGAGLDEIKIIADKYFSGIGKVEFTGYPPLYVKIIDYVMSSQINSFYIAISLIFILMTLLFRDFKLALIALVPNIFPVFFMLGIMGYLGVTLDIATATVAAIVLGVAIDDTIHLMVAYSQNRDKGVQRAILSSFTKVGCAVIVTSIVLFLGFLVLLFASVKTVFYFGLLTAIAVLAALIGDLILLPLLIKFCFKR